MDVAEATHSPAWPDHLEEDLKKAEALGKGRLAGFLFVAWDNEPSPLTDHKKINPRYEKLMSYRDRLIALDIPSDSIHFVFKKQLVHALTQPRFVCILKEILGLPCHSLPFRLISQESRIFGSAGRLDAFAPTKEEYLSGLVHRPAIADEIERRREHPSWTWIRGHGSAGKTVLAIQIALDYEAGLHPAYYLDLAKTDASASEALDVITTLADDQVLFIVDNVHLDEGFARDVFDHWKVASMGSRLLLLGRDVSISDPRGAASPLDELREEALTLEVKPDDLAGVFLRLARRFLSSPGYFSKPPHKTLQDWHHLFGGDLIAFSAAVAKRIERLTNGVWQLQAQDAAEYVRETYLERANEAERHNLLRIAVLAQLELDVPEEAIELAKIKLFLRDGVVHHIRRGSGRYEYYHLVHPRLGDLLLTAAGYSQEELNQFIPEQFRYVARRNPFCGMQIANRLESANRNREAISVLKNISESDQALLTALIASGLQYLRINCERFVRLKVLLESEIDQKLVKDPLVLRQSALLTPLHFLASFLEYAERKLPGVFAALTTTLARRESLQKLSETAMRTPLGGLASFLEYAERKLPGVSSALTARLGEPEAVNIIARVACRAPLDSLHKFLQTVKIAPVVVLAIDRDEWDRSRSSDNSEQPSYFPVLAGVLRRLGKPELAEAPARALISAAEPQHWHVPGIGLNHFSHVMRLGREAGAETVLRFLARIATPAWLEEQYNEASSYGIAAALFSLWGYYEQSILDHFRTEVLKSRVTAEMRYLNTLTPKNLSAALQLLGCSALIGVCVDKSQVGWPNVGQVREAICFAAPRGEMVTIGHIQIQFWLGLREIARMWPGRITVQAELGNQVLTLWKNSTGYTDKQNVLNVWMIDWLERCAQSGWMLIPDHTTLTGAVK